MEWQSGGVAFESMSMAKRASMAPRRPQRASLAAAARFAAGRDYAMLGATWEATMAVWEFKGRELVNCSCDYGCNCQFNGLPDKGHCYAVAGIQIDEGHHGEVKLDDLRLAAIFKWPGPIHEGHGEALAFVDERADEAQRDALLRIMTGQDTDPFATMFAVYASTIETMHPPVFTPIDFTVDVDARRGKLSIPDYVDMVGEPIRNKVSGEETRAQICLPDGFEYQVADIGAASSEARGPMPLTLSDSYGQFAYLHLNSHGVVRA
jgi:hypothetical protein